VKRGMPFLSVFPPNHNRAGYNSVPCRSKSYRPDQKGNAMAKPNYEFKKRQKEQAKKKKKEEKKQRKEENKSVENDEIAKETTH